MIQEPEKAEEYIEKIALKLEDEYIELLQKNRSIAKEVLNTYFDTHFKSKVRENLRLEKYVTFEDFDKEASTFKTIFLSEMREKASNIDLLIDQIFSRYTCVIYKDIASTKHRRLELELAAHKERLRIAEEDIQRERREMEGFRGEMEARIRWLEDTRVELVASNQVMQEKVKSREREKEGVEKVWQEKYDGIVDRLQQQLEENKSLQQKFEDFKNSQQVNETSLIKENNKLMNRLTLSENEVVHLKTIVDDKTKIMSELQSKVKQLETENSIKINTDNVLKEKQLSEYTNKQVEKYKLDYENLSSVNCELEANYFSLQKENIEVRNRNTDLVKQKENEKVLTKKLLEHLKNKIIEKHESN